MVTQPEPSQLQKVKQRHSADTYYTTKPVPAAQAGDVSATEGIPGRPTITVGNTLPQPARKRLSTEELFERAKMLQTKS